jgi:hypothetical protein
MNWAAGTPTSRSAGSENGPRSREQFYGTLTKTIGESNVENKREGEEWALKRDRLDNTPVSTYQSHLRSKYNKVALAL